MVEKEARTVIHEAKQSAITLTAKLLLERPIDRWITVRLLVE
jgi:hypothetical protein